MGNLDQVLLEWYARNARNLPWREHLDPYSIWISEIMLQQTRVNTVIPYYTKWMAKFPDIIHLAKATEEQVLVVWEGLGYYSRARNIHRSAQIISLKFDGKIPDNIKDLIQLPGIGRYTAGAVASIAFNLDEPTLDANIRRIFARVFNIEENLETSKGKKNIWALIRNELPSGKARDFNQALMDLGATICLSRNPLCNACPLFEFCQARENGVQEKRPVLRSKKSKPNYTYLAAIIKHEDKFLLIRRPSKGLLGGLWEFPNFRVSVELKKPEEQLAGMILKRMGFLISPSSQQGVYKHSYTHFKQTMLTYLCTAETNSVLDQTGNWVSCNRFSDFPMGKIARMISNSISR